MEMMNWLLVTLKWFQRRLLIWIPWWNSVWKILWRQGDFEEAEEQIGQLAEDRNDDYIIDENTPKTICEFSLQQENAIMSNDRRSKRDEVHISKLKYIRG